MTTVAVFASPPEEALPDLADATPLTDAEVADLYTAMYRDVCRAVETSGGELLVNYRSVEDLAGYDDDGAVEAALREAVVPALAAPESARFEVQVGSTFDARVGNTVTHLLEREEVKTAAVVEPTAPFLARQTIDNAAMTLRRNDVVLGPARDGRVYYAGFGAPVDFANAFDAPAVETVTERGVDAGLEVGYLESQPVVETAADLATAVALLRAHARAGRNRPERTAEFLLDSGLRAVEGEDSLDLVRE